MLFQIAQIQAVERRWKDVIATLEAWFQIVERPNSVGYYLMALSHYQLEDLDAALAAGEEGGRDREAAAAGLAPAPARDPPDAQGLRRRDAGPRSS